MTFFICFALSFMLGACGDVEPTPELLAVNSPDVPTARPTPAPTRGVRPTLTPSITPSPEPTLTFAPQVMAEVALVVKPIPAGYAIPPDAIETMLWPVDLVPPFAMPPETVVNQVTLVDIECHEVILTTTVARREVGSGFRDLPGDCDPPQLLPVPWQERYVVVALQLVPEGGVIPPHAVTLRAWPAHLVPEGAMTALADVIGQRASVTVPQDQVFTQARLDD